MVRYIVSGCLVVVAIIHLLPLMGVLGGDRLATLYGVLLDDANLRILMRHRAVLFGLLGVFLFWAAFRPRWTAPALLAGFVSVTSFLLLAHLEGGYNVAIARVVLADYIALAVLLVAALAFWWPRRRAS